MSNNLRFNNSAITICGKIFQLPFHLEPSLSMPTVAYSLPPRPFNLNTEVRSDQGSPKPEPEKCAEKASISVSDL